MKKLLILLLSLIFLISIPVVSLATGDTGSTDTAETPDVETPPADTSSEDNTTEQENPPAEENTDHPSASLPVTIEIDTENVYPGMDSAYKNGYVPSVANDTATIVLPLISSGAFINDELTVTPNLGTTANSPFVYENYKKTFSLEEYDISDTKVSAWLVRFDLPLTDGRYDGVYPVTFSAEGRTTVGSIITQMFTVYVTITDGIDPNYVPEVTPDPQPKLIIDSYSLNPSAINSGDEFELTVTLKNTSDTYSIYNMTITARCDSLNFTSLNESDVIYISKLKSGETADISLKYKTDVSTSAGKYNITLDFAYENYNAQMYTSSGAITVKVDQPLKLELTMPQISDTATAGETIPMSFQVLNLSRGTAYNVRCEISGLGLFPSGTAFIGNMQGGSEGNAKTNVFLGSFSMTEGYMGEENYGYTSGTVKLIYENEDGEEFSEDYYFGLTILEPVINAPVDTPVEEEIETAGQWWISVIILAVAVIAIIVALVIVRRRNRS